MDWLIFLLEGLLLGLVCFLGAAANALASYVLLTSRALDLSRVFVRLLVTLMAYDSALLFGLFAVFSLPHAASLLLPAAAADAYMRRGHPFVVPVVLPVIQIALTGEYRSCHYEWQFNRS